MSMWIQIFWLLVGIALPHAVKLLSYLFKSKREPYAVDHLLLNVQLQRCSSWLNMGYWKDTRDFPTACEALALKLAKFGDLQEKCRIKDVGFGCGDSLCLWLRQFSPIHLSGITSLPSQHAFALRKIQDMESIVKRENIALDIRCEDACSTLVLKEAYFDYIITLDCAYHFSSRRTFLDNCFHELSPNGKLLLTDLVFVPPPIFSFSQLMHRIIAFLANVPFHNLLSQTSYEAQFRAAGFNVEIQDVTPHVFSGLREFIERRDEERLWEPFKNSTWTGFVGFSKVLKWWDGGGGMKFVLVKATKR